MGRIGNLFLILHEVYSKRDAQSQVWMHETWKIFLLKSMDGQHWTNNNKKKTEVKEVQLYIYIYTHLCISRVLPWTVQKWPLAILSGMFV